MFDKHADEAIEAEIWLKAEAKGREQGLEEGRAQGLEQGREQGLEQGREEGREQERVENEIAKVARDKKIAEYLRSIGVSEDGVSKALSIK